MDRTYCPFSKDNCLSRCVFRCHKVSTPYGILECLIALNMTGVNDYRDDEELK